MIQYTLTNQLSVSYERTKMTKKNQDDGWMAIFWLGVVVTIIATVMDACGINNKEAEDAYRKLRDAGYTTQEIYEMGK